MRIRGISLISLLGFLLRGASSADADISSENLACVTLQTYSAQGCTGTATTQQFTTYTEPGHSECKAETKMNKTLFSFNNRYCKLSSTPETFQQTMYLFDQQNDCTPFLGLDLFKLDITFSVDECALGYYKLVSCVAGSCEANETLPDFGNGHLDQQNGTMGSTDGMESLGNATDTGGNVTDLPPPPDTSLGEIKKLCKKSYIAKHNDSDCYLTCEPGACCFLEDMDSCSNNTEVCALYKGCEDILSSNNTNSMTDINGTTGLNETMSGNETIVGGNETESVNGTNATDIGNVTDGNFTDLGNVTDGNFTGTNLTGNATEGDLPPPPDTTLGGIKLLCGKSYISKHNDSDCYLTCEPGTCCFLEDMDSCSNNTEVCALYKGCEDILSSNNTNSMTDINGTTGLNETMSGNETIVGGNETESVNGTNATDIGNVTDGNFTDLGNATDGNFTDLGNVTDGNFTGTNLTGNATEGDLPPPPDTTLGGIKLLCGKSYISKHNDSDCYLTCEPGTCCFLEGMDSCSNNTEVCALYKGCEDILSSNNTDANGTLSNSNITDMGVNGTEDGSVNTTIFGNETSVGGNDTAVDINGTSALESNGTTTGDVGNTTDSGLNGTASSDQNATGTNGTSSVGGHSILGSIGNAIDAITNGTMNNILGNVTIPGTALGIINSTTPWENGPGTINVTAPGTNDTAAAGGGTTTKPVNPMGNSAGAATGGDNPPLPDNSQGGPAVVCAPPYRKANGNVPCRLTCKPGACCFSSSADSCADNTETCALYALCEKILASRLLLRF
eukprot:CAMPEP_0172436618 /NCGR_PEP_ID=MMETSP1064-20121228/71819_1 /TAXON_ID=202472 /ORGANISM="Aulacoseira subarctica , Strain CCAP 1002/5" /LENGTH=787 /DNA_ID=CAMNT_0013185035 /DNA_START=124 /DNA_END=2490 /DNA_ORIENTATION=-